MCSYIKAMKQRTNTFPSSSKTKKKKKQKGSILFLMATRIMYLTAAVFLVLAIMSTTIPIEAGNACKHSSFLLFLHYM